MSAVLDFLPFPILSLPKRVIIQNRKLNLIYYLAHLPILGYAVLSFVVNMSYTEEIPNTPFTLIELNAVDAEPFLQYQLNNDPSEQVRTYCKDGEAGAFAVDCALEADAEICQTMFGFLLMTPYTLKVEFDCTRICEKTMNTQDPKCFLAPTALLNKGSQQVDLVVAKTIDSGPQAPGVMVRTMKHRTHPMIRDTVIAFKYSFQLVQPAPPLLGLEDNGARKTNNDAMTVIIDSQDIVRRLFSPGEVINITIAEIVEAAGAQWNYTMVFQGSEFIVSTNCFTAQRDLPAAIYWSGITPFYPREDLPLCLIRFSWLQDSHVSYSLEGGFGRDVKIRLIAQNGTSFSRLPSIEFSLLNLVSMVVLLSIPPAVTGWMARTFLGPLSKIYRQATQEKFDLPSQLATAGLNCIANVATFGSLASTTLSKEELKVCLKDALAHSKKQLEEKDLNRLTNFVFEKDPRYPRGARTNPQKDFDKYTEDDKIGEPRVDAARFAMSMSSHDPVTAEDIRVVFDSHRDRNLLERLFTPAPILQALKDQRGLDLPAWKKELFGVTDDTHEEDILGEEASVSAVIKVRSETTEVTKAELSEETPADGEDTATQSKASGLHEPPASRFSGRSSSQDARELLQDLEDRLKFQEDSQAKRLRALETHNDALKVENEELRREMTELKQQQAQLTTRCDRQLATMQELTRALRSLNTANGGQELALESQMPSSCLSAATSFQRPSA